MIVLHQILNKIGAQGPAINRIVFVYDEGVAVVAIEAVPGGKPHEAAMILQNSNYVALRQAILGGEVSEFEVPACEQYTVRGGEELSLTTANNRLPRRYFELRGWNADG